MNKIFEIFDSKMVRTIVLFAFIACVLLFMLPGTPMSSSDIQHITGYKPFDIQLFYRAEDMANQLPLYNDLAFKKYLFFNMLDAIFPIVYFLLVLAIVIRYFGIDNRLFYPIMLSALLLVSFDYIENYYLNQIVRPGTQVGLELMGMAAFFSKVKWWSCFVMLFFTLLAALYKQQQK